MSVDLTQAIAKARAITGNSAAAVASETNVPDDAITASMTPFIRQINEAAGLGDSLKEVFFSTVGGQQNYPFASIAADIDEIEEVIRSAAFTPDYILGQDQRLLQAQGVYGPSSVIPAGLQGEIFQRIIDRDRFNRADRYGDWEVAPGFILRLMPCPASVENVYVKYSVASSSITAVPDRAQTALMYGAVVAILNGMLNRLGGQVMLQRQYGHESDYRAIIMNLTAQKIQYQSLFDSEIEGL